MPFASSLPSTGCRSSSGRRHVDSRDWRLNTNLLHSKVIVRAHTRPTECSSWTTTAVAKKSVVRSVSLALNMTLAAFAAERRRQQQISIDTIAGTRHPRGTKQRTSRTALLLSIGGTDRQSDRQTDSADVGVSQNFLT